MYRFKHDRALTTHGAANFVRGRLAHYLRSSPYFVNMLLAGFDEKEGSSLYYMDYLASMHKIPFGVQGYGSYFCLSILDKYYRKDMSLEEAVNLLKRCTDEVKKRLLLNTPKFIVKVVNANGTCKLEDQ